MVIEDAIRWNDRYKNNTGKWKSGTRSLLYRYAEIIPHQGLGLDVAMGLGYNSKFLLAHGLKVIGVDISSYAVLEAKKRNPELLAVIGDLTNLYFGNLKVDVVLNFYYLHRELLSQYPKIIKRGGILFVETLANPMRSIKPEIEPKYLLEEGELITYFKDWEILHYFEGWVDKEGSKKKAIASLVARCP
jgi:tellurite methyltransferase